MSVVSPETLPENIPNLSDEDLLRFYNEFASIPPGVSRLTDILCHRAQLLKAEIDKRDRQKERAKQKAHSQTFNIQHFTGVLGGVTNSTVNIYDYSSINQQLKERNVPQAERNELENILDELKTNPASQKRESLIQKGKAWIVKNQEFLGAGASIVRQALGIPDVA
jgi:hypothetical protein